MPYIKVNTSEGVMYEYNADGTRRGKVGTIGLNTYKYLEQKYWSSSWNFQGDATPLAPDYTDDIPYLAGLGFKYITVMMTPFSGTISQGPLNWKSIVGDPDFAANPYDPNINDTYWAGVNLLLDTAAKYDMGVIAAPFWNLQAVADLCGENLSTITDPDSKLRKYMRVFAKAFVARYKSNPAIAGWLANQELTSQVKTLTLAQTREILSDIANIIRAEDELDRMITSCNISLQHNAPSPLETIDHYAGTTLPAMNPDPIDTISENLFLNSEYASPAWPTSYATPASFIHTAIPYLQVVQAALRGQAVKKPYYVSSFGLTRFEENELGDYNQENLSMFLHGLARAGVQLASFWVWNAPGVQETEGWNLIETPSGTGNGRRRTLEALAAALPVMKYAAIANPTPLPSRASIAPRFPKWAVFEASNTLSQYVVIPNKPVFNTTELSLSFTIRQSAFPGVTDLPFISNGLSGTAGWVVGETIMNSQQKMLLTLWKAQQNFFSNSTQQAPTDVPNAWTRITLTVKNGGICLYVNDFLMHQTQNNRSFTPSGQDITVGRKARADAGTSRFEISDLIIYNRALTPQEVFDYGTYGVVHSPVGRWTFNNTFEDSVGDADGDNHGAGFNS